MWGGTASFSGALGCFGSGPVSCLGAPCGAETLRPSVEGNLSEEASSYVKLTLRLACTFGERTMRPTKISSVSFAA